MPTTQPTHCGSRWAVIPSAQEDKAICIDLLTRIPKTAPRRSRPAEPIPIRVKRLGELRTPITGIKLSHRLIGMDPDKQPVYMERMGREIERLHDIIENLLRLSRLDQGRVVLDIKPLNLNTLAIQYVGDRTPLAKTRQLTLSLREEAELPLVQADEGLLGQVLSILLTNALSYTPAGGGGCGKHSNRSD